MKFFKTAAIGVLLAGASFSCDDFLTEVPQSQVDASTFYTSAQAAEIGITGCYNRFFNENGYSKLVMLVQASTDDIFQETGAFHQYQTREIMTAANGDQAVWKQMYQTIANVNFLLQEVEGLSADIFPDPNRKQEILGEAHFLKGVVYYYLYSTWGEVPLVKEFSEDPTDLIIAKSSKEEVKAYVIEELEKAEEMLPEIIESYPNAAETNLRKGRASKWAAKAYLARLALVDENWQEAVDLSDEIIESSLYPLADVWRTIFQEPYNATESIFEQQNDYSPGFFGSGIFGWFMGFDFEWSDAAMTVFEKPDTIGKTQGKDIRFDLAYTPHPWGPRFQPNKIIPSRLFANGGIEQANFPIIRTSEMLLIKAEALNELNFSSNKDEVISILNALRARAEDPTWVHPWGKFSSVPAGTAGIAPLDAADFDTQEELRTAIREEKRRELIFEDVVRFTDLMRWDKEYLKTAIKAPSDDHLYWPIPTDEVLRNELLEQNPAFK